MWSGKLFTPRGLSGLQKIVRNEMAANSLVNLEIKSKDGMIEGITRLGKLSRLRIPQSIWVPLIQSQVESIPEFRASLMDVDWSKIPALQSHGPRITISRDNLRFHRKSDGKEMLEIFKNEFLSKFGLESTEFSLRINHDHALSLSVNLIPPRPWIDTPTELTISERAPDWGSSIENANPSQSDRPSQSSIRKFRNDSSLACLCAAFLRTTAPFTDWVSNQKQGELVVWDPFAGDGSILMETLLALVDSESSKFERNLIFVASTKSAQSANIIKARIDRFVSGFPETVSFATKPDDVVLVSSASKKGGRKSKRSSLHAKETEEVSVGDDKIQTIYLSIHSTNVEIHITTVPFQETFPYISGALIVSHIPKTYTELTGIDKHQLSEWTAFGSLLKSRRDLDAFFFSETNSFTKYSKLKFSRSCHLVSPNGTSVGHFSKWLGV